MIGSFQAYLPLDDLWKILVVCLAVAVVSPAAAALVIDGFDAQSRARDTGASRTGGDLRIVVGVLILGALVVFGILALASK